jgi:radical SAM protein with 4Fe4S-binding SPASM domain
MLSNNSCSPCYTFGQNNKKPAKVSCENIRDIFLWASDVKQGMPQLFFLASEDEPLDPSVAAALQDIGEQVVTPLLSLDVQKSLGIPFSSNQTVIARNLHQIMTQAHSIAGRPMIVHIERDEINSISENLLAIQEFLGIVTLRLRDIHLLEDEDIRAYEQQLSKISDISFMKQATGSQGRLAIANVDVAGRIKRRDKCCPAGAGFMTVGPDGGVYPCPAFYHAGQDRLSVSIDSLASALTMDNWGRQECGICGSATCRGCPFLESNERSGRNQVCKLYQAERRVEQELLPRIAKSGYLFDCLRTLKTKDCAKKSGDEGGIDFTAGEQVYDVEFEEFVQTLKDLKSACKSAANNLSEDESYRVIMNQWSELSKVPSNAQKNIFRRRIFEILAELQQIRIRFIEAKKKDSLLKT